MLTSKLFYIHGERANGKLLKKVLVNKMDKKKILLERFQNRMDWFSGQKCIINDRPRRDPLTDGDGSAGVKHDR